MTKNSTKLGINRIPFSRLLKLEVPELAEEVIAIVEKHDPELLQINPVFDLLVARKPEISKLKTPYGVDPVRLELKPIREKLSLKASAIKLHLRLLSKTTDKGELHVIQTSVDRHLRYLNKSNMKVLNQKITGFLDDVETDAELSQALSELNFTSKVEDLEQALAEVRVLSSKRVSLLSQRPQESTKELVDVVLGATSDLFKEIEVAQLRYPEVDFVPLVHELNELLDQYRTSINIRLANNKRKANYENFGETYGSMNGSRTFTTEDAFSEDDSNEASQAYLSSIEKAVTNGSDSDSVQSLDQKKTVAVSAKQMQPSVEDDEA